MKEIEQLLTALKEDIEQKKAVYNNQKGQQEQLKETKEQIIENLKKSREEIDLLEQVNIYLQQVSDYARQQAKEQIEALVTQALQFVFGEQFSFEVEIEEKRSRPAAEFYVVSKYGNQKIKNRPQDARGGGVVDVVSLALRIAVLQTFSKPKIIGPLVLDEPTKHVSEEYITRVTKFLKNVAEMYGRQIIVVTHQQHLSQVADRALLVELDDSKSQVKVANN
ncbi:MAG: ATP-binding protein [Bacillota bacterium]